MERPYCRWPFRGSIEQFWRGRRHGPFIRPLSDPSSLHGETTMADKKPATKTAKKPAARSTTAKPKKKAGFTAFEKAAMKERAQELKAGKKVRGEGAVLAKIAEMPASDRAIGERLHAVVTANAPDLTPKLWYGMPAYAT